MALTVENGTGVSGADSYATEAVLADYAAREGVTYDPSSQPAAEVALRQGSRWVDNRYRGRFVGYRLKGRAQGLEWPRRGAYVASPDNTAWGFETLPENEVPQEIINAACEAALRELASPGSLSPDLAVGMVIQSVQADTVSVNFAGSGFTPGVTMFTKIDEILATLLPVQDMYSGRIGRC